MSEPYVMTDENSGAVYVETNFGIWCADCFERLERRYDVVKVCPVCVVPA